MSGKEYFAAAVPEPWTILGLRLRSFSAGHLILLSRIESAFVAGGEITWEDLASSVFICANTFEDAVAALDNSDLVKFMQDWSNKLFKANPNLDLNTKASEFQNYLTESSKTPKYTYNEGGSSIGDVPPVQFVKAYLMFKTNMTESEILNRPWRLTMWDFLTIQAIEGNLQFSHDESAQEAIKVAERLQALVKSGKIKCRS